MLHFVGNVVVHNKGILKGGNKEIIMKEKMRHKKMGVENKNKEEYGGRTMKITKKIIASLVLISLLLSGCSIYNQPVKVSAAGTPSVTEQLTMAVGEKKSIKVKGTNIKSKTFKSTKSKIATVSKKGIVTAKKAGWCKVKVTVKYVKNKKTLKKVFSTIINAVLPSEMNILRNFIKEQKALGAKLPDENSGEYGWGEDGRLYTLRVNESSLKGSISFSVFENLEWLTCYKNKLTDIDISGCKNLMWFKCDENQLSKIDVGNCKKLLYFSCNGNQLTKLDISACTELVSLNCGRNQITELDVHKCSLMEQLDCSGNQITSLSVSGCSKLNTLYCAKNQMTELDISGCEIGTLNCRENQLAKLDISGCPTLSELYCDKTVELIGDEPVWIYFKEDLYDELEGGYENNWLLHW